MKVLLIGWDGADWKIIHKLIEEGRMPNLEKLISEGVMGNLATLYPSFSPMLWTSIATGKRPYKHKVLGFIEPDPSGEGVRPITSLTRQVRALWNIMTLVGKKSVVVGWWPSHPAEPISGVMVSNHYHKITTQYGKPWPLPFGTVHPPRLFDVLAKLRIHPQELDTGMILKFVPKLSEIDQDKDKRVESIAKIVAENLNINRAATAILDHEPWDFAAIYYDGIDHFSHGFMNYHPPKLPWVSEKDYEFYKNVVSVGYEFHDFLLGTLLKRINDDTLVILVSDHGFHSDHLRPKDIPMEPAGPAVQHRYYGIFVARGPGIKKDEVVYGANLLDVCPTILAAWGLPIGEDMDGKVLINIFEKPVKIETIPSWEDVEGYDGSHPDFVRIDPEANREALKQLVELGYIQEPDDDKSKAAEDALKELKYNEARSYMDAGLHIKALPILEELFRGYPSEHRFGVKLVECLLSLDRIGEAREVLEETIVNKKKRMIEAKKELREFTQKLKDKKPEEITRQEKRLLNRLRVESSFNPFAVEYLKGLIFLKERKFEEAISHFVIARKYNIHHIGLLLKLGEAYLGVNNYEKAEETFKKVLKLDPERAEAYLGLSKSYLGLKKLDEAIDAALDALGLRFFYPAAHFCLGVALHRKGKVKEAVRALEMAVRQNPNYVEAYRRLAYIYRRRIKDYEKSEKYMLEARRAVKRLKHIRDGKYHMDKEEASKIAITSDLISEEKKLSPPDRDTVVIVSGLPRSGTSLMMQMLKAGGLEILTDNIRKADENNPKGYYEFEKVKDLKRDTSWLKEAKGKVVKIVAPLIPFLPDALDFNYRVVFMIRNLDEVVASQKSMLERMGKEGGKASTGRLKKVFFSQMQQAMTFLSLKNIPTLFVDYNSIINDPEREAERVNKFLGGYLKVSEMVKEVDPNLKRHSADREVVK